MPALHIKATAGPRPIDPAAVRQLLAQRSIAPESRVLSLDAGRSWIAVQTALAVADQQAVDEATIHAAVAGARPLHPLAMPLGALGFVLLAAGIAFGGGPAAQCIAETPVVLAHEAQTAVNAVGSAATAVRDQARLLAASGWSAWTALGRMPASATGPDTVPAPTAATTVAQQGDLPAAWKAVIGDQARDAAAWDAAVRDLGERTVASGIVRWPARLTQCEPMNDSMAQQFPQAKQPLRLAIFQATAIGDLPIITVVEDEALAKRLDALAAGSDQTILSADVFSAQSNTAERSAVLMGRVRALE